MINDYIQKQYGNNPKWFMEEVNQHNHAARIADVVANRDYLAGRHKVLNREDSYYKGKKYITRKTILNYAKTVIRFHDTFLLGNPVSLSCQDSETLKTFNDIYKLGQYETVDYQIIDRVNKFGDAFEVIYVEDSVIKSKVLDSACCYPVYDDKGEYVAFIEHWTDVYTHVSYWNVYYPTYVECWSNDGGDEHLLSTTMSIGLPIHYHNFSDKDYNFGESMLTDIKPIMDELEDLLSKFSDSIYTNTMNVLPIATGQYIESSIPADATGYVLNLDNGDFKYASCNMDYNSIKLLLDNLKQMLNDIACIPSVLGSSTNVANISEVAMKILFAMAEVNANECKKWLNTGFKQRFKTFQKILNMQGISVGCDVDVVYNVAMPVAGSEMISNLKALQEMGAVSVDTIMEKVDLVSDPEVEKVRLQNEKSVVNPSDEVGIE